MIEEPKVEIKEPDLVTRVSQVKEEPKEPKIEPTGEPKIEVKPEFNFNDIQNIKDPEAKAWAEKAYKSFQSDYTIKTKAVAEERKSLESQVEPEPTAWTPDKLQQEMNRSDFQSAARQVLSNQNPAGSGLTDDEYSALSEKEKQKFQRMEQEISLLKQQSSVAIKAGEDIQLKDKYANYNSGAVDIITADLISGKVQATREDLWKVVDYNPAIKRAYELGKQDRKLENQDKITSMSPEGGAVVGGEKVPEQEKGESDRNWFVRIGKFRMAQKAESGQVRK